MLVSSRYLPQLGRGSVIWSHKSPHSPVILSNQPGHSNKREKGSPSLPGLGDIDVDSRGTSHYWAGAGKVVYEAVTDVG